MEQSVQILSNTKYNIARDLSIENNGSITLFITDILKVQSNVIYTCNSFSMLSHRNKSVNQQNGYAYLNDTVETPMTSLYNTS